MLAIPASIGTAIPAHTSAASEPSTRDRLISHTQTASTTWIGNPGSDNTRRNCPHVVTALPSPATRAASRGTGSSAIRSNADRTTESGELSPEALFFAEIPVSVFMATRFLSCGESDIARTPNERHQNASEKTQKNLGMTSALSLEPDIGHRILVK
ncbi:hypothetical protein [Nocardia cyriacigeorgica]|uniref:hypothetical protein n=1 Tax=Nocardia cyriacigeorgica TaxID=135487 RepID=UPI00148615FC|nr:hypothetical protein [Nocardia cyriacigeorgica]MBF6456039.1 hypothetical protein [Nocardia cyriacigeorgica]